MVQGIGHLGGQGGGRLEGQPLRFGEQRLQRLACEQLHGDVGLAVLLADVVDDDDVRVAELSRGACLAQEALPHLGQYLRRQVGMQRLDRELALDERIQRAVHGTHRAAADLAEDAIAAERPRFGGLRIIRHIC